MSSKFSLSVSYNAVGFVAKPGCFSKSKRLDDVPAARGKNMPAFPLGGGVSWHAPTGTGEGTPEDPGATWRFHGVSRRPTLNVQRPPTTRTLQHLSTQIATFMRGMRIPSAVVLRVLRARARGVRPLFIFSLSFHPLFPCQPTTAIRIAGDWCGRMVGTYCAMPLLGAKLRQSLPQSPATKPCQHHVSRPKQCCCTRVVLVGHAAKGGVRGLSQKSAALS